MMLSALLFLLALAQADPAVPIRLGDAQDLSSRDVTSLQAALAAEGKLWLLVAEPGQPKSSRTFHSFLLPETETTELRRGTVVETGEARAGGWALLRKSSYAQVAVPGRSYTSLTGESDINRPFIVTNRFEDSELISLVTMLRASDRVCRCPIAFVSRRSDEIVEVRLREGASNAQSVLLKWSGNEWSIERISNVVG